MVTAIWILLAASAVAWEACCHRHGSRWTSLAGLASRLWASPIGRAVLIGVWGFVGWHVFARYTVPG